MNILITGSNGFIGSHVAEYLKSEGHYIIGLGRRSAPSIPSIVDSYIKCNLGDDISSITQKIDFHVDAIIHLAADMRKEPFCDEVIKANCVGTYNLLEMASINKVKCFLQLSSLPVIGSPKEHPISESHPLDPYTVYHITKVTEELLAQYASKKSIGEGKFLRTASFRISAPLGPRMNPKTIFPTFVNAALNNEDIVLLGNGTRKQNYVYVKDIARCLSLALESENVYGVYNLTSNILLSNKELAQLCIDTLHSTSRIKYHGVDPADTYVWDASISKIRKDSGYEPIANIKDIIEEYANFISTK